MMKRTIQAVIFAATLSAPARADIQAFNAAVSKGDYAAAATEAETTWPTLDKARPDIVLIAREFGFASYMAGNYAAVRTYGQFLAGAKASDDQPLTSAVLLRAGEYRLDPIANGDAMLSALKARAAGPDIDNITVLAGETYYRTEWSAGRWAKALAGAKLASELLGRAGDALAEEALEARVFAAAADFLVDQDLQDLDRMADVLSAVAQQVDTVASPAKFVEMRSLLFLTEAWFDAMGAYLYTAEQKNHRLPRDLKWPEPKTSTRPLYDTLPPPEACVGMETTGIRKMDYPKSALFAGFSGAVVLRLDFDEEGKATAHEVLAAVPARQFADAVDKAAPDFRRIRDPKVDKPGCRLDYKNKIMTVLFSID